MNNSETKQSLFLENMNWLYEYDFDRYKIIELFIKAFYDKMNITISKDLNVERPVVSILIDKRYIHKHQCDSDEEANMLIDIVKELSKEIKRI
ncbi:hypothetical protein [Romboutsia timonensis]|uniref:hypothetical protein n=1 Tax=Romboutsia timonensis TaxID=1776391 RepID=UPI002A809BDD|nr:hypothetical protein [Romboutsia timonensis]MDY3960972.1 hypothetical protein [Romboutsia timonensis]